MLQSAQSLRSTPAPPCATRAASRRPTHAPRVLGDPCSPAPRRQAAAGPCRRASRPAAAAVAAAPADPEIQELKMALIDSFWGTERGLAASSDSRAEINELVTQLEARNPTPEPTEAAALLGGTWRLAYTANSELLALLALGRLPLVSVGDITQSIDPAAQTVENRVELSAPLSATSLSATASFEVRSPKLVQVSFQEGRVATPQLLADLQLPASLDVLGTPVDLAPLQAALQPVEGPLRSALGALGGLLGNLPDLRVPVSGVAPSSWLLTTYLDDSMRITRGDGGSVFVLLREAAPEFGGAAMQSGDWEALAELEPAATAAGTGVPGASGAAATTEVVVVEPSEVIEGGARSTRGSSNGSMS